MSFEKKAIRKSLVLPPLRALLGHPARKDNLHYFALVKKSSYKPKLRYSFLGCVKFISEGIFGKILNNEDFGFRFLIKVKFIGLFQAYKLPQN